MDENDFEIHSISYLRRLLFELSRIMKLFISVLVFLFVSTFSFSQNYTIRGFIYDNANGEPIAYEKVKLLNKADSSVVTGATTGIDGFFSIAKVNKGSYIVKVESPMYDAVTENIEVNSFEGIKNFTFNLKKREDVMKIDEVTVTAESKINKTKVLTSVISLDKKSIERIPSVGGENDIISAFSITPGVVTTGDQGGQLYVRGGTPIQNKILLDGMTIYSPFHSIGFFSIFETELISNTDIYTGGFDAKYGGRISSIMDITYRDGDRQKFGGKVSVSPFMAKALLEGPIGKKRLDNKPRNTSYVLSAKHSLLNYTSKNLYRHVNEGTGMPFTFTDLYGKIAFNGEGGSKFTAFGFHNRDSVNYGSADLDWQASGGGINFVLVPSSSPIYIKGHLTGSHYKTAFQELGSQPRESSIGGFDLGFDFTYFMKNESELNYGISLAGFNTTYSTFSETKRVIENNSFSTEVGAYVSYRMVRPRWVFQPSVRLQGYPSVPAISIEPRFGLKFNATEKFRLKMSGGRYSQNLTSASSDKDVVNLFNGILAAPDNIQSSFVNQYGKQRDPKNGIQYAWHAIFGFEADLTKHLSLNVEGFYKLFDQLSNINILKVYDDTEEFAQYPDELKKDFLIESGESYGIDFLMKYSRNRLYVWGVYSLQKSTRWNGFEEYAPVFDRRHNVNLVVTYLLGEKKNTEISARWNLGSGLPFTPTAGFYQGEQFGGGVDTDYTTSNPSSISVDLADFNSGRLPSYHRLDITLKQRFTFKNKSEIEATASVTNVYNRKNIFYVNRVTNEIIYQFPILPSLGLSYNF